MLWIIDVTEIKVNMLKVVRIKMKTITKITAILHYNNCNNDNRFR